jgi:hypothetical protein
MPRRSLLTESDKGVFTPKAMRELIAGALPTRQLTVKREPLVKAIVERIETWRAAQPLIAPHATKVRRAVAIADKLNSALKGARDALLQLGVAKEIERAKARRIALGIDPHKVPLAGHSVTLDLYLIPWRALDGLQHWNRLHRPSRHRPKEFAAALTADMQRLCRKVAGCSAKEFEVFYSRSMTVKSGAMPACRS